MTKNGEKWLEREYKQREREKAEGSAFNLSKKGGELWILKLKE